MTASIEHTKTHDTRICEVVAQLSSRAGFMFADGREAFELLADDSKQNLRVVFDALADELHSLTGVNHG